MRTIKDLTPPLMALINRAASLDVGAGHCHSTYSKARAQLRYLTKWLAGEALPEPRSYRHTLAAEMGVPWDKYLEAYTAELQHMWEQ